MMQRVCATVLLVALIGAIMSELGFKSKKLFSILSFLLILIALSDSLFSLIARAFRLAELAGISEAAKCALKAVGAGYTFGFVDSVLKELGESTLSTAVAIACRIDIFLIVLPYFEKTVELGVGLLQ